MSSTDLSLLVVALLLIVDWSIRIAAIIIIPRNRRPTAAMAWLLAVFFIPYIGVLLFLLIGNPEAAAEAPAQAEGDGRVHPRRTPTCPRAARPTSSGRPGSRSVVELNSQPQRDADGRRQHRPPDRQTTRARSTRWPPRSTTAAQVRARRVLHPLLRPDDRTVLRRPRGRGRARREGARAARPLGLLAHAATTRRRSSASPTMGADVVPDAAGAAAQGQLPAARPAQPPQDPRRRRPHGVRGVAEPDRPHLQQEVEHQARPQVAGARRPRRRARRRRARTSSSSPTGSSSPTSCSRSEAEAARVDRRPAPARLPGRAERPRLRRREQPAACSSRCSTTRRSASSSRARTSCPTRRCSTRSPRPCSAASHVDLFVSEIGDQALVWHAQRSYYEALLRAGVRIYMYKAPYILHAKHFTIDDDVAVIGSSNMDMRSFGLNMEVSLMVRGQSFVAGDARRRGRLPRRQQGAHPRRLDEAAAALHGARQSRAAHERAAVSARTSAADAVRRRRAVARSSRGG